MTETDSGIVLEGTVTGLPPSVSGGWVDCMRSSACAYTHEHVCTSHRHLKLYSRPPRALPYRFHIHSGVSCATTSDPGGHYYDASSDDDYMSSDPWTTTYTSDASGAATIDISMDSFTLASDYPVSRR